MAAIQPTALFDDVIDFLASAPTSEQIIAYQPSEALAARLAHLLEQNRQGSLSPSEQGELDEFLRLNHFMTMLRLRTRQKLVGK